ncbi:MAG: hypothetical protein K2L56_06875 [Prevotella sp.]|nr:hypothetical protein [Prevotella sp.]
MKYRAGPIKSLAHTYGFVAINPLRIGGSGLRVRLAGCDSDGLGAATGIPEVSGRPYTELNFNQINS